LQGLITSAHTTIYIVTLSKITFEMCATLNNQPIIH